MTSLLTDPHRLRGDLRIIAKAVKDKRFNTSPELWGELIERMRSIVRKTEVLVPAGEGVFPSAAKADENAAKAAKVLLDMEKMNQADEHHAEGSKVKHEHSITVDERRTRLLDRLTALRDRAGIAGDSRVIEHDRLGGPVVDADEAPSAASGLPETDV